MKLAIFGAGMIVKDFLTMLDRVPNVQLKAIMGVPADLATMEEMQAAHHIDEVYTDVAACLSEADIDTVYVALPNFLHYRFTKLALEAGKNVICEKPFVLTSTQAQELAALAEAKGLVLVEAITNQYLSNYAAIKQRMAALGDIKVIECNYSQYSHRYDAFQAGTILPAFDPKKGGGALMDLNIYNIHFVVGLMGAPLSVHYYANVERNIDTSGALVLNYPGTQVVCVAAKDCSAPVRSTIQGNRGSIQIAGPVNVLTGFTEELNDGTKETVDEKVDQHRMYEEFVAFEAMIADHDLAAAKQRMAHSLAVMNVVDAALADAGIKLG